MIFVGDISKPTKNSFQTLALKEIEIQNWFGNLEGGIIDNSEETYKNFSGVYNDVNAMTQLVEKFNFSGFVLANNHIFDLTELQSTISYLNNLSLPYCGIGNNSKEATKL